MPPQDLSPDFQNSITSRVIGGSAVSGLHIAGSAGWHFSDISGSGLVTCCLLCCRSRRSFFHLPNLFFHLFARLEGHDELLWHKYLITGPRITSFSSGSLLDFKDTEVSQLDSSIFHERFDNRVERLLNDLLGLELCQPNSFGNVFDNLFLGHVWSPPI